MQVSGKQPQQHIQHKKTVKHCMLKCAEFQSDPKTGREKAKIKMKMPVIIPYTEKLNHAMVTHFAYEMI